MSFIERNDAEALIPEAESREIMQGVASKSIAMQLFKKLPNLSTKVQKMAVLSALPVGYWVNGDNGQKKLTKQVWANKYLTAEEIAVIVPISEAVLDDAEYDIWGETKPRIIEAFGKVFDDAVISGVNKPASYPSAIITAAEDAGYTFAKTSSFFADCNKALDLVEGAGYTANGILGGALLNSKFRNLVGTDGHPVTGSDIQALPRYRMLNGAFDNSTIDFIVGDFSQAVYALRQDITWKLLTESIIQDPSDNSILYNLGQNDMVALRAVMRIAYQLPNPVNLLKPTEAGRLPFAVCKVSATKLVVSVSPGSATTFTDTQVVSMSADVYGAKIYYTNDGSAPDATKTLYTAPITLSATKTIKAIAILADHTSSDVVTVVFTKS